jgi:hypothetical protein
VKIQDASNPRRCVHARQISANFMHYITHTIRISSSSSSPCAHHNNNINRARGLEHGKRCTRDLLFSRYLATAGTSRHGSIFGIIFGRSDFSVRPRPPALVGPVFEDSISGLANAHDNLRGSCRGCGIYMVPQNQLGECRYQKGPCAREVKPSLTW